MLAPPSTSDFSYGIVNRELPEGKLQVILISPDFRRTETREYGKYSLPYAITWLARCAEKEARSTDQHLNCQQVYVRHWTDKAKLLRRSETLLRTAAV